MSILEGIDYRVELLPFPNLASEALVLSNGDGSYVVLLNTRYPEEVLRRRLEHELAHIRSDHLHQPERPIAEKEAEAEGVRPPLPCLRPLPAVLRPGADPRPAVSAYRPGGGDYFHSWSRAMAWAREAMKTMQ